MARQFNRHQFAYPAGIDNSEPRLGYRDIDAEGGIQALMHPAAVRGDYLPAHVQPGYDEAGGQVLSPVRPHVQPGYDEAMRSPAPAPAVDAPDAPDAPGAPAQERSSRQQKVDEAYQYGQQYLNNPFDAKGRARMGRQFMDAPLGGHVRRGLEGQELFGHTITGEQALMAERGLAGLTAVGVGVPAFLAAVNQLSTPQSAETIPL